MIREDLEDWDQPLPFSEEINETDDSQTYEERRHIENVKKLNKYVEQMAYAPPKATIATPYIEKLANPRERNLVSTADDSNIVECRERGDRLKRLAGTFTTTTTEYDAWIFPLYKRYTYIHFFFSSYRELEKTIRTIKFKDLKKEDILKRKHEIYYTMLDKLERQSRSQYLNVLINKFSNVIANIATTMYIPPHLVDPYARMHRGIFCNTLLAIGIQPKSQTCIYYNTKEGSEYEEYHRLSHAILGLIIKALDSASMRKTNAVQPMEVVFNADNFLKDRLICAAEKKLNL